MFFISTGLTLHMCMFLLWSTEAYWAHREGSSYEEDNNAGADTNEGEGGRWRDGVGRADAALVPGVGGVRCHKSCKELRLKINHLLALLLGGKMSYKLYMIDAS